MVSRWFEGGFGQELDDFPIFPNDHRNAHEAVLLGGFLHGPLHDFGNFLDALVSGFHGRSRGRGGFKVSMGLVIMNGGFWIRNEGFCVHSKFSIQNLESALRSWRCCE